MDAEREREIIRLWHRLRLLEREGRPVNRCSPADREGPGRAGTSCSLIMCGAKSSGCGRKFIVSAAKSGSFNGREFRPHRRKHCWSECSTRSTICARSGTGSRSSSHRPSRAGSWVDGHGDRAPPVVRREGRPFAVDKSLGRGQDQGHPRGLVLPSRS
jgi:hypothetical protein